MACSYRPPPSHQCTGVQIMDSKILRRFWSKVNKHGSKVPYMDSCCWEWTDHCQNGYGGFNYNGKAHRAHRIAWLITNGRIDNGMCILHKCDNRKCVNPSHLFIGTGQDNVDDMVAKSRQAIGVDHGISKLSEDKIREIRMWCSIGYTHRQIASAYGVSNGNISHIRNGATWGWVK